MMLMMIVGESHDGERHKMRKRLSEKIQMQLRDILGCVVHYNLRWCTPLLAPERAALCESGLTASWLSENLGARAAQHNGVCVREDGRDGEAAWALDVHVVLWCRKRAMVSGQE